MGTAAALEIIKVLPLGMPKLLVSTIAYSPLIDPGAVPGDLMLLPWAGGLWGLNNIVNDILQMAAAAITAAVSPQNKRTSLRKRTVGITSLGSTRTRYLHYLKPALEKRGYDVAVFHATGMGGRILEQAVAEGRIDAILDLSPHDILSLAAGSPCAADKRRMEAAGKKGVPQIVSIGSINQFFWPSWMPFPEDFENRVVGFHNPLTGVVNANDKEKEQLGVLIANRLTRATGPKAVIIPMIDQGIGNAGRFRLPDGGGPCAEALKANLNSDIKVIEIEANRNDPEFSDTVLNLFDQMMPEQPFQEPMRGDIHEIEKICHDDTYLTIKGSRMKGC